MQNQVQADGTGLGQSCPGMQALVRQSGCRKADWIVLQQVQHGGLSPSSTDKANPAGGAAQPAATASWVCLRAQTHSSLMPRSSLTAKDLNLALAPS